MSQLTLILLQLAFLALMWVFVFAIVFALRSDLFGTRVRKLQAGPGAGVAAVASAAGVGAAAGAAGAAAASRPQASTDTAPATSENARRLVLTSGSKAGAEVPLTGDEITIGRSVDSSLIIRDDYTSTHHARLSVWNGQWMLQDMGSTNGTFLSGVKVEAPIPVPLNTEITVGQTTFELRR